MPLLMLKDLPRYECLLEAARDYPDLDPSATEVFLHLLRAGDEVFRVVESNLARHDISQGRFGVLMALWGNERRGAGQPPLSPASLAERTGVTRATMTGLIDTLVRDGLVRREADPADRRMVTIRPTARAEELLARILPGHFQRMATLMRPLGETERGLLVGLLQKIVAQASVLSPEPAGDEMPMEAAAGRG
jgi:DNA-binding MarR family transcriptional regulator